MEVLANLFSVDNIAFTILNYPISWIELVGTVFNALCVFYAAKKKIITWPLGLVAVTAFSILFYQYHLYADFTLNAVFFNITGLIGWYQWSRHKANEDEAETRGLDRNIIGIVAMLFLTSWYLASIFYMNCHTLIPFLFPQPAAAPVFDSLILVGSIFGQILMMMRYKENWLFWIVVNIVATILYWSKGVKLVSIEYLIFTINAFYGYWKWGR